MKSIMKVLFIGFLAPLSACVNAYVEPVMLSEPVRLYAQVENQNEFNATIFAYWNGIWDEIGRVESGRTIVLPFRWNRTQVRFVIVLEGNDERTGAGTEDYRRVASAADAQESIPCHLSAPNDVEPELTLMLVVNPELVKNRGGSRCHGRPR